MLNKVSVKQNLLVEHCEMQCMYKSIVLQIFCKKVLPPRGTRENTQIAEQFPPFPLQITPQN